MLLFNNDKEGTFLIGICEDHFLASWKRGRHVEHIVQKIKDGINQIEMRGI